jgi:hypothetical protein
LADLRQQVVFVETVIPVDHNTAVRTGKCSDVRNLKQPATIASVHLGLEGDISGSYCSLVEEIAMLRDFPTSEKRVSAGPRQMLSRGALTLVWCAVFFGAPIARADIITFVDATDFGASTLEILTTDLARTVINQNNAGGASVTLLAPSPTARFVSDDCPFAQIPCSHLNIGEFPINPNPFLDFESDVFSGIPVGSAYQMFMSIQTTFPCAGEGGCRVREDGLLYIIDTVTWSDGTVDTIRFQAVPEVSSLAFLATAALLAGIVRART